MPVVGSDSDKDPRSQPQRPAESETVGKVPDESTGADETGTIDWLAVMGNPDLPTAPSPRVSPSEPNSPSEPSSPSELSSPSESSSESNTELEQDNEILSMSRIAKIAAVLVIAYLGVNFVDVWIASRSNFEGTAAAAIVLGAAQYNGEPSQALQGRLDHAAELYDDDRVRLVVVTGGGQAEDITTEAKTGYNYLRDTASIPDEDLRLEVDGTSTYLSLAAAARFLAEEGVTDVIVVTDPYHAKRSKLIAEEVGLQAEVSSTGSSVSLGRLIGESGATSIGRIIGFRRLDAYVSV